MALTSCPECGVPVDTMSAEEIKAHVNDHWPEDMIRESTNKEAWRRRRELRVLQADKVQSEARELADRGVRLPEDEEEQD